jgi:hypothetical protein
MPLTPVSFKQPVKSEPRLSKPYVPGRRDKRYWTDAEIAAVREYFPKSGAAACLPHVQPHRSIGTVYQQAHKMGLSAPGKQAGKPRKRHDNTPEMDEVIRREWPQLDGKKRGEVAALADRLGLDRWVLSKRATRLGLTMPHKKEPPWTKAEIALMSKVPLHDPHKCARIFREHGFRRSETAIVVKAKRLNLSRRATREELSATKAAKLLGVDGKTMTRWIIEWGLPATKRDDNRLAQQGGPSWDIKPADLRRFIIDNLEHIDLRKVEKFAFVDLIANE